MFRCFLIVAVIGALLLPQGMLYAQDDSPDGAANLYYFPSIKTGGAAQTEAQDVAQQVVRIYLTAPGQLHEAAHTIDLFEEATTEGYAVGLATAAQIAELRAQGVRVEVDPARTEELQAAVAEVHQAQAQASSVDAINTIPGYSCYRTVEETYTSLSNLATTYPNLVTKIDIGDSWHKFTPGGNAGYDLFAFKITDSSVPGPKPKFLLMSAIHAREYTTAELATRFVEDLVTKFNANTDADAKWLLQNYELHVIPHANPDGRKLAEAGQLWRKNVDNDDGCATSTQWGTDLNRNSTFKWGWPGASSAACNETYRGPSAGSEPEVQAIQSYATSIFPDQRGPLDTDAAPATAEGVFISLHSYSQLVLFPWGWTTTPAPNTTALQTLGRKFGFHNGYQVCNGPTCLYAVSGVTDDFTYGEFGVASYTFELGTAFFQRCNTFNNTIAPRNMPALYTAFKASRRPYQEPAGPEALTLAVSPATVNAGTTVNLTASINDTRYNSNGWGTEPTQAIAAARYSIDTPIWQAASPIAMSATDGVFNATIEGVTAAVNTTGLSSGKHIIYVQGRDAAGNWGLPSAVFVTIN